MGIKQTRKFVAATKAAKAAGIKAGGKTRDGLYQMLGQYGYWWDRINGVWSHSLPPSTSEFELDDGTPSGVFKVRVTAHLQQVGDVAAVVAAALSEYGIPVRLKGGPEVNQTGPGARIYYAGKFRK